MIKIELHDGTVLPNDPRYGNNLDNVAEIQECLDTTHRYHLVVAEPFAIYNLYDTDIKRIYEE